MAWSAGDRDSAGNVQVDFIWGNMPMQPSSRGTDRDVTFSEAYDYEAIFSDAEPADFGQGKVFPSNEAAYSASGTERFGDSVIDAGWWNNYPGPQTYNGWD